MEAIVKDCIFLHFSVGLIGKGRLCHGLSSTSCRALLCPKTALANRK